LYVKVTVLLWSIATVPTPEPSVCANSGTIPVADVLLLTVAFVSWNVKISDVESVH